MIRRGYPLIIPIFIVASLFLQCNPDNGKNKNPNIILILADDLGYGDLGCYGQKIIETPNIDRLAGSGMKFSQFYSGSPVCAPARCTLLTGKHTGHAYIRGNDEWGERGDVWDYGKVVNNPYLEGQRPIPDETVTLGEILQADGYSTACIGKWGLGGPLTDGAPNKQGFDFFFGYNCQRQAHTYYPRYLWKNYDKVWLDNELVVPGTKLDEGANPYDPASYKKFSLTQYAPVMMLEEALSFIDKNKDRPFFLFFASPIPHVPLQAPQSYVEKYITKIGNEAPYLGDKGYFPNMTPHATYAAMVNYLDFQVGEIVKKIHELGLDRNTLILFTSDNGPAFNGGADSPFFDSAGPFKSKLGWGKGYLHEGGIREPLIVNWKGRIKPGTKSEHLGAFYDILPTLLDFSDIKKHGSFDGISFKPELLRKGQQVKHEFLYWEFPGYGGQQAIRMGKWKGIREGILEGNINIQLYDLEQDVQEQKNVSMDYPDIREKIIKIMDSQHKMAKNVSFRMKALGDNLTDIQ